MARTIKLQEHIDQADRCEILSNVVLGLSASYDPGSSCATRMIDIYVSGLPFPLTVADTKDNRYEASRAMAEARE